MADPTTCDEPTSPRTHAAALETLRAVYPDWTIWASDRGHLYAGRCTPQRLHDRVLTLGLAMTVDVSDPSELAARLAERAERAEAALAIWGTLT